MSRLISLLLILALSACSYRTEKAAEQTAPQTDSHRAVVFSQIQSEIISPSCIKCHNGARGAGGVDLSSYSGVMAKVVALDSDNSAFYTSIRDGRMPKRSPPLSRQKADLVKQWISDGALETAAPVVDGKDPEDPDQPDPGTPQPTYAWLSQNVFVPKCAGCHSGSPAEMTTSFDSYQDLLASPGGELKSVVPGNPDASGIFVMTSSGAMPMDADEPLSPEGIAAIKDWIAAGALEFR